MPKITVYDRHSKYNDPAIFVDGEFVMATHGSESLSSLDHIEIIIDLLTNLKGFVQYELERKASDKE